MAFIDKNQRAAIKLSLTNILTIKFLFIIIFSCAVFCQVSFYDLDAASLLHPPYPPHRIYEVVRKRM